MRVGCRSDAGRMRSGAVVCDRVRSGALFSVGCTKNQYRANSTSKFYFQVDENFYFLEVLHANINLHTTRAFL